MGSWRIAGVISKQSKIIKHTYSVVELGANNSSFVGENTFGLGTLLDWSTASRDFFLKKKTRKTEGEI